MVNRICYEAGSLLLHQPSPEALALPLKTLLWDDRTREWRCLAWEYRALIQGLQGVEHQDEAKAYERLVLRLKKPILPRAHQTEALQAWSKHQNRGTVCLPTGGGKTILGVLAMELLGRPTLVVVPTIDLMHQWYEVISGFFGSEELGLLGGGYHEIKQLTITTYDSAAMHMESMGNRFGFLILDECHHLPGETYQKIALASIAPFRLGLSATLKRSDGKESLIEEYVGPLVYEGRIGQMVGVDLAPYEIETWEVSLTQEEEEEYKRLRQVYTRFIGVHGIQMGGASGWSQFLIACHRYPGGKAAFAAYREQKKIAQSCQGKLLGIWEILTRHGGARVIIFTEDNQFAYRIGHLFFLPVLTHQTGVKERKKMLDAFRQGLIRVIVTSKVLNEGVDVPEASVAIVVSGSGAVREHVQRLGRILRKVEGKQAVLYELIAKGTGERFVNQRRREHEAYS
jgi:superfamily II DNA or RNA helicase